MEAHLTWEHVNGKAPLVKQVFGYINHLEFLAELWHTKDPEYNVVEEVLAGPVKPVLKLAEAVWQLLDLLRLLEDGEAIVFVLVFSEAFEFEFKLEVDPEQRLNDSLTTWTLRKVLESQQSLFTAKQLNFESRSMDSATFWLVLVDSIKAEVLSIARLVLDPWAPSKIVICHNSLATFLGFLLEHQVKIYVR